MSLDNFLLLGCSAGQFQMEEQNILEQIIALEPRIGN